MDNKIQFGKMESIALLVNLICAKVFLGYTRACNEIAGCAGWILSLYICVLALIGFYIIQKLCTKFEGKDIIDIAEHIAGMPGRLVIGTAISIFFAFVVSVILRDFSESMKSISLTVSPISFVTFFFIIGMVFAAYKGLEAIVRFHLIVVPVIIVGSLFIYIAVSPFYDIKNLTPIFGLGIDTIFIEGSKKVSNYAELIALLIIAPYIKTNKNLKAVGYWSLVLSGVFMTTATLLINMAFPYQVAVENFLPIYNLSRLIMIGRFFQRVESIFLMIWAASALLYLSSGFYFMLLSLQKAFKLPYYKPLILPGAIIIFTLSLWSPNLMDTVNIAENIIRNWAWVVTFGMTILLLIIAKLMRKEIKHNGK